MALTICHLVQNSNKKTPIAEKQKNRPLGSIDNLHSLSIQGVFYDQYQIQVLCSSENLPVALYLLKRSA